MLVHEVIRVVSAGNLIRHGIYRDFPTRYSDRLGNRYVVGFTLLAATRDGAPEESRVEDLNNGVRIYLGRKDSLLPAGGHSYTIRTDEPSTRLLQGSRRALLERYGKRLDLSH